MQKREKGLTLIEVTIALAVLAILALFTASPLSLFRDRQILTAGSEEVGTILNDARERTLGALDDSAYGVHFTEDSMTLFKGGSFSPGTPGNIEKTVNSRLTLSSISLAGGGDDIVFKRLSGETEQYGTITVALKNESLPSRTLTIYATGVIEK
jgi:prepilin-type N-terminal cleavage/methylation domain-containing protein